MKERSGFFVAKPLAAALLALSLGWGGSGALAQGQSDAAPTVMSRAPQILAGDSTGVMGRDFKPGSKITLTADGVALNAQPFVADEQGRFRGEIKIPAQAARGPLAVAVAADGAAVADLELKISEKLPLAGADGYMLEQNKLQSGLYQAALGEGVVYVTSAFGPPGQAGLLKVDARTLKITDSAAPPASKAWGQERKEGERTPPPVYSIFGAATDPVAHTIWVSNTVNDTAAVYRQGDLSLLRQFEDGVVPHARAVEVDGERGKAYVAAYGTGQVAVFDTRTLQHLKDIEIKATQDGQEFGAIGLALDAASGALYVASMKSPEVARISTTDDSVQAVWTLEVGSLRDLAWDARGGHVLAADYGGDSLLVIDPATGQVVHRVGVGASPLAVTWEPVSGHAFVANRGAGTVTVVDPATGKLVANLAVGSFPNHLVADDQGNVYVVNKSQGPDDAKGDLITRIRPKAD